MVGNTMFQKVKDLLAGLYSFYHQRPLNRANLLSTCELLNKTPLMPTRSGGTRWVDHLPWALDNFLRGYTPIVQHLKQGARWIQQAKAKRYFNSARGSSLLRFCGFLHDTLSHLSSLSATLQKSGVTLAEAHSSIVATKTVLEKEGPMLKATSGLMYEGVELARTSDSKTVKSSQDHLLAKLISSLEDRFKDFSAGVLSATKLSSFHNWADPANAAGLFRIMSVKSDWRLRLTPASLSDLLTVQLMSAEIKSFDPNPAIDLWSTEGARTRRPDSLRLTHCILFS
ncbi:hypothetical protein ABVT39_000559 [Epinephelus coioides]